MFFTVMTLMYLHMGMYPVMEQYTVSKEACEYIKFEADHNLKGLMVKCDNYAKL